MPTETPPENAAREVAVPRWAVEAVVGVTRLHLCDVCLGSAPSWDGHDRNPPCHGAAVVTLREALDA